MQADDKLPLEYIDKRKLSKMISEIRLMITDLLYKISDIYSENAVRYPVNQFQPALCRMLLPLQFNILVNKDEIEYLFESSWWNQARLKARRKDFKGYIGRKRQKQKKSIQESEKDDLLLIEETSKKMTKKLVELHKEEMYQKSQSAVTKDYSNRALQRNKELMSRSYGYEGDSRMPSHGYEEPIRRCIMHQFNNGNILTKVAIRAYARSIGAKSGFKASQRWCQSFLNRNPDIKEIIYAQKKIQKLKLNINNSQALFKKSESSGPKKLASINQLKYEQNLSNIYEESDKNSNYSGSQINQDQAEFLQQSPSMISNIQNQIIIKHR